MTTEPENMIPYTMYYPSIILPEKYSELAICLQKEVKFLLSEYFPEFNKKHFLITYIGSSEEHLNHQKKYTMIIFQVYKDIAPKLFEKFDYIRNHPTLNPKTPIMQSILDCDLKNKIHINNVYGLGFESGSKLESKMLHKRPFMKILALDGRGVPGLALIPVLKHLEKTYGNYLSHSFDWIIGSSTGGILAIMLNDQDHIVASSDYTCVIKLLENEFKSLNGCAKYIKCICSKKNQSKSKYKGNIMTGKIFDYFISHDIPSNIAITVGNSKTGCDMALTNGVSVRNSILSTMAEDGILPIRKDMKASFNDDPLPVCLELFELDNIKNNPGYQKPFILSIGTGRQDPNILSKLDGKARYVRWQVPFMSEIAFDDVSKKSLNKILNIDLNKVDYGGVSVEDACKLMYSMEDLWNI